MSPVAVVSNAVTETFSDALAEHERDAGAILRAAGYADTVGAAPGPKHWHAALSELHETRAEVRRAASRMFAVSRCRAALAGNDVEAAAWSAYLLADAYGYRWVDIFERPILHGAKLHAARRENEGPGPAEGIKAAGVLARAANPRGTAKQLWRWIAAEVKAKRLDVSSFKFEVTGDELVQIDAKKKRRAVSLKTFANEYTPPKRD